jgi:hypothetical protein
MTDQTAPLGFAASVTDQIRSMLGAEMAAGQVSASLERKARWRVLSSVAGAPHAAGDRDARIRALHRVGSLLAGGDIATFTPGAQQSAYLQVAGLNHGPDPVELTGETLIGELLDAGLRDVENLRKREQSRHEKQIREAQLDVGSQVEHWRTRCQFAEREAQQQRESGARLEQNYADLKLRYDDLRRAALGQGEVAPVVLPSEPVEPAEPTVVRDKQRVSPNIYARVNKAGEISSYQVDVRGVPARGGFSTQQEAEQWRDAQIAKRDREKRAPVVPEVSQLDPVLLAQRDRERSAA